MVSDLWGCMGKLHARFWHYDGNHHAGRDCKRYDPHEFGVDLISYVAYCADHGQFQNSQLNLADIKVTHSKGDSFGHQIKVSATAEIWKLAKADHAEYLEEYYQAS